MTRDPCHQAPHQLCKHSQTQGPNSQTFTNPLAPILASIRALVPRSISISHQAGVLQLQGLRHRNWVFLSSEAAKCLLPPGYPASSTCRVQRGRFWGPSLSYDLLLGCSQRKESSYSQAILCTIYANTLHHKKVVCFLCCREQECWVSCHASYFVKQKKQGRGKGFNQPPIHFYC